MTAVPKIRFLLIPEIGDIQDLTADFPGTRRVGDFLHATIDQYFKDGDKFEHVAVLYEGERRDMFVGENSSTNGKCIRNVRATAIYRNSTMTRHPKTFPEALASISGPAILFPDRVIWT